MSITSLSFAIFLIAVIIAYYLVPKRLSWIVLLAGSLCFYISISALYYVIFTSITFYIGALVIRRLINTRYARLVLYSVIIINVLILCFFKYSSTSLITPIGISFYTFSSIGYLVDVYRGKTAPQNNYARFLLFVSFFPSIVQGPINNYDELSSQLYDREEFSYNAYSRGCRRIIWGLFKKMVVADILAEFTTELFVNYNNYIGLSLLAGVLLYSIQLYADFSGYMDIVCGFCESIGIRLAENFNRPFFSKSMGELWRRWHMSLGRWFKEYIYIPLGGSRCSKVRRTINFMIVFLISGIWHGSTINFLIWGLINGLFVVMPLWTGGVTLSIYRLLRVNTDSLGYRIYSILRTYVIFAVLMAIPFIGNIRDVIYYYIRMFVHFVDSSNLSHWIPSYSGVATLMKVGVIAMGMTAMLVVSMLQRKGSVRDKIAYLSRPTRWGVYIVLMLFVLVFGTGNGGEAFIYAQF